MFTFRKIIGLVLIAAVLNPLCCCFAQAVPADAEEAKAPHSCCPSQQEQPGKTAPDTEGCGGDSSCPHQMRLSAGPTTFDLAAREISQPLWLPGAPVLALAFAPADIRTPLGMTRSGTPPDWHGAPVFLLTKSIRC